MRLMYDSVTASNIPTNAFAVGGYINGRYVWSQADWDRFPNAHKITIAISANADAKALDVETYDATPAEAPAWAARQRAWGEAYPWIYMSESVWPEVRRQFSLQGVPEPIWWVAAYPGYVPIQLGASAHQYVDVGPYDLTNLLDYIPGFDNGGFPVTDVANIDMTVRDAEGTINATVRDAQNTLSVKLDIMTRMLASLGAKDTQA